MISVLCSTFHCFNFFSLRKQQSCLFDNVLLAYLIDFVHMNSYMTECMSPNIFRHGGNQFVACMHGASFSPLMSLTGHGSKIQFSITLGQL